MKFAPITLIALMILFLGLSCSEEAPKEKEKKLPDPEQVKQIYACYADYNAAILSDQGEVAAELLDTRTVDYYAKVLNDAIYADRETIEAMSLFDKVMVFSLRHRATDEELLSMDGKGVLTHAVKNGMISKNSILENDIGEVMIDGDFAKARFMSDGEMTPLYYHFYKEEGKWKLNLTSMFNFSIQAFKDMQAGSGQTESEYVFGLLKMMTGKMPKEDIWEPVTVKK